MLRLNDGWVFRRIRIGRCLIERLAVSSVTTAARSPRATSSSKGLGALISSLTLIATCSSATENPLGLIETQKFY